MILRNMLMKDELDDEFVPEVTEECSKFGHVRGVKLHTDVRTLSLSFSLLCD